MSLIRKFVYSGPGGAVELPDPDPAMGVDDVRKLYASQYPALTNAAIIYPDGLTSKEYTFLGKDAKQHHAKIEFKATVGKKG